MFAAIDGAASGLLGVADPIKESTSEAIRALHAEGLRIIMLTGDSRTTAEAVARQLGIDEVLAEVLPGAEESRRGVASGRRSRSGQAIGDWSQSSVLNMVEDPNGSTSNRDRRRWWWRRRRQLQRQQSESQSRKRSGSRLGHLHGPSR